MASMEEERLKEWLQDLLSTAESGLALSEVFTIFQEDFGQNFPSVNLGFPNSVKVLESFTDIIIVETNPETGEKVVSAVDNFKFPVQNFRSEDPATCLEERHLPPILSTSRLKPQRGTYQLTFLNHFQLEKTVLLDYFQSQSGFVGANIFSELKRRCFVYYKTEKDALNALAALKQNDNLYKLDVADDCKLNTDDYTKEMVIEEEEEIFPCMGSFQLTFTTTHFVNIPDVNQMFSEFGQVAEVCSNFRKVKGRARVFVKYFDKINALGALKNLRYAFDDLSVAKCCLSPLVDSDLVPEDRDGLFCLTFKNSRREGGELFSRGEIFQMFQQFGHVEALFMNSKLWAFIKFGRQEEAQAALKEFQQAQTLPQLGFSDNNSTVISKPAKFDIEETDSEIFIGNFPSKIGYTKLRRIFTNFQDITFRELKVNDKKAYSFAHLPSYEEIKRAVKELNGTNHFNRRLIVRHKVQSMQEQIERELLDEMNNDDVGGESWGSDVAKNNTDTLPDLVEDLDHVDHVVDSPSLPVVPRFKPAFIPPQMERKHLLDNLSNKSTLNSNLPPPENPFQSDRSRLITSLANLNVNSPPDFTKPPPMLPKGEDSFSNSRRVVHTTRRPQKDSFIQYNSSNEDL